MRNTKTQLHVLGQYVNRFKSGLNTYNVYVYLNDANKYSSER